jgi:hypothetical protein
MTAISASRPISGVAGAGKLLERALEVLAGEMSMLADCKSFFRSKRMSSTR